MRPLRQRRAAAFAAGLALAVGLGVALAGCQGDLASTASLRPTPAPSPTLTLAERLRAEELPPRDDAALARDLWLGGTPVPRVVRSEDPDPAPGHRERFWISDLAAGEPHEITATLQLRTEHLEMWVQDGSALRLEDLERSAQVFEERIYPANRALFGPEWTPGVDGNPRLTVLNAPLAGAAGYYSAANQYPRLANPTSNEREMFVMNTRTLAPGSEEYESVLAHEFQHMIHWHQDPNEDSWLNEGLSELAEALAGYGERTARIAAFAREPDLPLTRWAGGHSGSAAHYGASYLFVRYLYDAYGAEAIRALTAEPRNGLAGVDRVLAGLGSGADAESFYADWLLANTLGAKEAPAVVRRYAGLQVDVAANAVGRFPTEIATQLHQYGADYYLLEPDLGGALQIGFRGAPTVRLVPNDAPSGRYQWWSNRGDNSHTYLERAVDLTGVPTATLTFRLWFDLEEGWDYALLRASTDGGVTWRVLQGAHAARVAGHGAAPVWGYTGRSGAASDAPEWVAESVDLSHLAGRRVLLRFDVVTDDSVNEAGLCLDDLAIPEIGWLDDVEQGEEGWRAAGFLRHDNTLPQGYIVQIVTFGEEPAVRRLEVGSGGAGAWRVDGWGSSVDRALLVVSAVAPKTAERATYTLALEELAEPRD